LIGKTEPKSKKWPSQNLFKKLPAFLWKKLHHFS
jgi:hypothetical protein